MIGIATTTSAAPLLLTEPTSTNPFVEASEWLEQLLLGSIATSIAVIAVGALGILLLTGQVRVRRGITVILGCFLLFGSNTIANGIRLAFHYTAGGDTPMQPPEMATPLAAIATPVPNSSNVPYDPYAGAAVPQRR